MKDSSKFMLAGLGVSLFARGWAEEGLHAVLAQPDEVTRVRDLQRTQALSILALAGNGLFWYGVYKETPKLAIGLGVASTALAYAPRMIKALDRTQMSYATGHMAYVATLAQGTPYWLAAPAGQKADGSLRDEWGVYSAQPQGGFVYTNIDGTPAWVRAADVQWAAVAATPPMSARQGVY